MKTIILDGDVLVYEACLAHETEVEWAPDQWTLHGDFALTRTHFDEAVASLVEKLRADEIVICLSDYVDPWRKKVLPTYKSGRATRKPVTYKPLREYVHANYRTFQKPGLEADDVCGILLTHRKIITGEKVLVSEDKDMKTLPGEHFNLRKGLEFTISPAEADFYHMAQTLTGDAVDGYKGCPGAGPAKVAKLLNPQMAPAEMWRAVVGVYEKASLTEADALVQARVARICRATDYDFEKKEVRLWNPPQ